jgi:hypothetical protein
VTDDLIAMLRARGVDGEWLAAAVQKFLDGESLATAMGAPRPLGTAP